MASMLASCAVDRGFDPGSGQTKDNTIDICCLPAKQYNIKENNQRSNGWFRNQDNVSEWGKCLFANCCFTSLSERCDSGSLF